MHSFLTRTAKDLKMSTVIPLAVAKFWDLIVFDLLLGILNTTRTALSVPKGHTDLSKRALIELEVAFGKFKRVPHLLTNLSGTTGALELMNDE